MRVELGTANPSFALWAVFADMKTASVVLSEDQTQITLLQTGAERRSFMLFRAATNESLADRRAFAALARRNSADFVFRLVDLFVQERVYPDQGFSWLATNLSWIVPVLADLDYPLVGSIRDALSELGAGQGRTRVACWILNELSAIAGIRPLELAQLASRREKHRDLRTGEVYLSASALKAVNADASADAGVIEKRIRVIRPKIAYADPLTGIPRTLGRGRLHGTLRLWAVHADCLLTQQFLKAAATNADKGPDADLRKTANLLMRWIIQIRAYMHEHRGHPLDKYTLQRLLSVGGLDALYRHPVMIIPKTVRWGFDEIVESLGFVQKPVDDRQQLDSAALAKLAQMAAHLQDVLAKMP